MSKKNTSGKKPVTKAVVTKKDLMWAGGNKLLEKSQSKEVQKEKNSILVISNVLNVSPFGVNVLGGIPYINKLGRRQKLSQLKKGERVEYKWIQRSKADDDKAICEAFIVNAEGERLSACVRGEASPATIKMSTLKGYQNHLAQTRAHNRVIEEYIGVDIHEEMLENVAKLQKGEEVPMINTSVSAEEINPEVKEQVINSGVKKTSAQSIKDKLKADPKYTKGKQQDMADVVGDELKKKIGGAQKQKITSAQGEKERLAGDIAEAKIQMALGNADDRALRRFEIERASVDRASAEYMDLIAREKTESKAEMKDLAASGVPREAIDDEYYNKSIEQTGYSPTVWDFLYDDAQAKANQITTECCGVEVTEEAGHCPNCGEPIN